MKKSPMVVGALLGAFLLFAGQAYGADCVDRPSCGADDTKDYGPRELTDGGPLFADDSNAIVPDAGGAGSYTDETVDPSALSETNPTNSEPPSGADPAPEVDDDSDDEYDDSYDSYDSDDEYDDSYDSDDEYDESDESYDDEYDDSDEEESASTADSRGKDGSFNPTVPAAAAGLGGVALAGTAFALGRRRSENDGDEAAGDVESVS